MKILLLSPSVRLLGARQSLLSLATGLMETDEPMVICPGEGELTDALRKAHIPTKTIPHGAWRKASGHLQARFIQIPKLRQTIHDFQPDVVHCNEFHSTPQAAMALNRKKMVVEKSGVGIKNEHFSGISDQDQTPIVGVSGKSPGNCPEKGVFGGENPHQLSGNENSAQSPAFSLSGIALTSHVRLSITPRQIKNYYMEHCDRVVAVSEACQNLFQNSGMMNRVDVIYNGIDLDSFFQEKTSSSIRADQGWKDSDVVFGLLGLVSPRKNQLVAIEAIRILRQKGHPVRLILAGDAFKSTMEYGEQVREVLKTSDPQPDKPDDQLSKSVLWLPFQKDVQPLYAAMDANLLISAEEGFGRTIIEAGALGKPSIGTTIGGIPELIADGETGSLVEEGNPEKLAMAMEAMVLDRQKIQTMGQAARTRVREYFTLEAYTRKMKEVWEQAARCRRG